MQLDLCLRSLAKHSHADLCAQANATVIYSASTPDFEAGYQKVAARHPAFAFKKQTTFRIDTLGSVDASVPLTMFLVDDIVFKEDFRLTDEAFALLLANEQMLALSLRLSRNTNYCYALNQNMQEPRFTREVKDRFLVWQYRGCQGDWGYGLSVDGNVYNTQFILWLLEKIDFHNPNTMEAMMNHPSVNSGIRPLFLSCYDNTSKLLNVPANRVQDEFQNRNESSFSAEDLNTRFLGGERISLKNITGINNFSCHYPIDFQFIKEK